MTYVPWMTVPSGSGPTINPMSVIIEGRVRMQWVGYEALTVSTVSVGLAAIPADRTNVSAIIRCETNPIRFRGDAVAPTAAVGFPLNANDTLPVTVGDLRSLRFIRSGAADGVIHASYYVV